jgi:hypothetical protein
VKESHSHHDLAKLKANGAQCSHREFNLNEEREELLISDRSFLSRSLGWLIRGIWLVCQIVLPVMRTRSPSRIARGITATSGRHGRSCEGAIEIHQTTTAKNTTRKIADMPLRGDIQQAQTANAAKAAANVNRSSPQGRFE